jgi:hypothetical protein
MKKSLGMISIIAAGFAVSSVTFASAAFVTGITANDVENKMIDRANQSCLIMKELSKVASDYIHHSKSGQPYDLTHAEAKKLSKQVGEFEQGERLLAPPEFPGTIGPWGTVLMKLTASDPDTKTLDSAIFYYTPVYVSNITNGLDGDNRLVSYRGSTTLSQHVVDKASECEGVIQNIRLKYYFKRIKNNIKDPSAY